MTSKRLAKGCLVALLVSFGGCGVALLLLVPEEGPPVLSALSPGADLVVHGHDAGHLWEALETSPRAVAFREGPAWKLVRESPPWEELQQALARAKRSGFEITRSRASHLVGREAGAAIWLSSSGEVRKAVAAFRIDTVARIAELAAGRLFLGGKVTRREERGAVIASLGKDVCWSRLGDLLLVSTSEDELRRAVDSALARTPRPRGNREQLESTDIVWSADPVVRFGLKGLAAERKGVRLAARLARLDPLLPAGSEAQRGLDLNLRAFGLPTPVESASISLHLDGTRVCEETLLGIRGPSVKPRKRPVAAAGSAPPPAARPRRPARTFFHLRFRPGRGEAVNRLWRIVRKLRPARAAFSRAEFERAARSGLDLFRQSILPHVGEELTLAVVEQDVRAETGGFPAQLLFFRVSGASGLRGPFEEFLRARSLGVFAEGNEAPASYPYLVRRRVASAWVYEMVIYSARRTEGYRPALAICGDDLVHSTSLEALDRFLTGGLRRAQSSRDDASAGGLRRAQTSAGSVEPSSRGAGEGEGASADDTWLGLEGPELLRLEWRAPGDFRPLEKTYDYFVEFARHRTRDTSAVLDDSTDYHARWRAIESALREVRSHDRVGVLEEGGEEDGGGRAVRFRAVWDLGE